MSTSRLYIRLICVGCAVLLFGALLNGIVYVANDFTMPVIIPGPSTIMKPSVSECMFVGKGTYAARTQTVLDPSVNLPYLADWIYINQHLINFHSWPRPLRFLIFTVACFPEGAALASPGDLFMWGGLFFLLPMFLFMGMWSVFRFCQRLR